MKKKGSKNVQIPQLVKNGGITDDFYLSSLLDRFSIMKKYFFNQKRGIYICISKYISRRYKFPDYFLKTSLLLNVIIHIELLKYTT